MPIQPPAKPVDGDEVQISFFNDVYTESEVYLNKAIKPFADFKSTATGTSPVVKTRHIYKPDFYGSPSTRCEAVSSETYWRQLGHGIEYTSFHHPTASTSKTKRSTNGWVPVRNLGATIHIQENNTPVTILSSFYAYEMGGALEGWGDGVTNSTGSGSYRALGTSLDGKLEMEWCAEFVLFIDGARVDYTDRFLYASTAWQHMHSRKQFSIVYSKTLSAGIHHINIMCNVRSLKGAPGMGADDEASSGSIIAPTGIENVDGLRGYRNTAQSQKRFPSAAWKHIMVGGRSLIVDVHAL
tara:strand:+ start:24569 stop:25459 length:891 start_codon:yes stop_codon:yes gene_type:complete